MFSCEACLARLGFAEGSRVKGVFGRILHEFEFGGYVRW
jgi:hypothetical protein